MSLSFARLGFGLSGADPLVCAGPLDPPVASSTETKQADEGVARRRFGCRPGVCPTLNKDFNRLRL
jgi:hypothetical protein